MYKRQLGVKPDVPLGLCLERSPDLIVAVLAILKAGGAYLPLDCAYPADRLQFMLANASAPVLITQSALVDKLPTTGISVVCLDTDAQAIARYSTTNPQSAVTPEHLAYTIYTSGSTGQPKGVAMPHRPLVNLIAWQLDNSQLATGSKTLQYTPIGFDVSFQEIFATFASGGTLVLVEDMTRRDPVQLLRLLQNAKIERLFLPFVALRQLADVAQLEGIVPTSLREVITAGEQLRITPQIANSVSYTHLTLPTIYSV